MKHLLASSFRAAAKTSWQVPLIALSLFVSSRPYRGIVQDAYINMGRALADLDPNEVGRDLMFVNDGQFGFSLFCFAAKAMVWCLGLAMAAKALAVMAVLAWFFAAAAFARQFAKGAAVWAVVIFAALLPASYGAAHVFGFAELQAIPRPFAEALVLAGIAALAARRDVVCLCCLVAAAVLHPIMALAGLGVFVAVLGLEDKRWLVFCAFAGVLLIAAGALGAPLLDRLFTVLDPSLTSLQELHSPFLFPSLWPMESFPPLIVQTATFAIAAHFQQGRRRRILAAIIVVGLGGIASSAIFGDWLSSLLVVQVQPWRTAWLMSAAGAMALGVCAIELWPRGPSGRMVLALLALGWSFQTQFGVAAPATFLALVLHFGAKWFAPAVKPQFALATWVFTVVAGAIWQLRLVSQPWHIAMAAPAGYGDPVLVLLKGFLAFPVCGLAAYFAVARPRVAPLLQTSFALLLVALVVPFWDRRSPAQQMEENRSPVGLTRLIDQRQGEVLWIDGWAEPWFMLGRPQWATALQGFPTIFSPGLATEWRRRTQILMDLRLADQKSFARWSEPRSADSPRLSEVGARQLCLREDAPAWIVAPLDPGKELPAGIDMKLWRLPEPHFKLAKGDGEYVWQKIDAFGVLPCAKRPVPKTK
ncbi:MAG: hypothetical protein ACT4O2_15995 [Beijerinckiaceae bacterium]